MHSLLAWLLLHHLLQVSRSHKLDRDQHLLFLSVKTLQIVSKATALSKAQQWWFLREYSPLHWIPSVASEGVCLHMTATVPLECLLIIIKPDSESVRRVAGKASLSYSPSATVLGLQAPTTPITIGWTHSPHRWNWQMLVPLTNNVNALHSRSPQALPRPEDLFPWQPEGNFSQSYYCAMHHDQISPRHSNEENAIMKRVLEAVFLCFSGCGGFMLYSGVIQRHYY